MSNLMMYNVVILTKCTVQNLQQTSHTKATLNVWLELAQPKQLIDKELNVSLYYSSAIEVIDGMHPDHEMLDKYLQHFAPHP